jgi:formylglycine-generating enzyme required for sulfatase activity
MRKLQIVTNSIGYELVLIPAGTFLMGSPEDDEERDSTETLHSVTLSKPFYMGRTKVSQSQWKAVMPTKPWKGHRYAQRNDETAASYISWEDAVEFCGRLSEKEGRTYRLPTEAEWEYACRAGKTARYTFGDDESELGVEWLYLYGHCTEEDIPTHGVSQEKANAFGLYDMQGDVWEWCSDFYDDYPSLPTTDPRGPESGHFRVLRGGNSNGGHGPVRFASRGSNLPSRRASDQCFRLVLE